MSEKIKGAVDYFPDDGEKIYLRRGYARRFTLPVSLLLSKLHWHYLPTTKGIASKKVKFNGKEFIARKRSIWAKECGMSLQQLDDAITVLVFNGIVEKENHYLMGTKVKVLHLRFLLVQDGEVINDKEFFQELQNELDKALLAKYLTN
jgi:hypothetical protein